MLPNYTSRTATLTFHGKTVAEALHAAANFIEDHKLDECDDIHTVEISHGTFRDSIVRASFVIAIHDLPPDVAKALGDKQALQG